MELHAPRRGLVVPPAVVCIQPMSSCWRAGFQDFGDKISENRTEARARTALALATASRVTTIDPANCRPLGLWKIQGTLGRPRVILTWISVSTVPLDNHQHAMSASASAHRGRSTDYAGRRNRARTADPRQQQAACLQAMPLYEPTLHRSRR